MSRTPGLAAAVVLGGVQFIVGCSTTPGSVTQRKLPFTLTVVPPQLPESDEFAEFADNIRAALERVLAEVFVNVVSAEEKADLKVQVTIRGRNFGEGTIAPGAAALSTVLWLAAGHLSWFIEDREYSESDVEMTIRIRTAEESGEKEVYYFNRGSKGLKLNNMERSDVRYALLNILVPPAFVKGDSEKVAQSLTDKLLREFEIEAKDRIFSSLPRTHMNELSCFLQHENDSVILISRDPIKVLEIGEGQVPGVDVFGPEQVGEREIVDEDKFNAILNGLSQLVAPEEDVLIYEFPLGERRGEGPIPIKATLSRSCARWTILHNPAEHSPDS